MVAILLLGPIRDNHFVGLGDAKWYEKLSLVTLITGIVYIGMAPLGLSSLIRESLIPIIDKLL